MLRSGGGRRGWGGGGDVRKTIRTRWREGGGMCVCVWGSVCVCGGGGGGGGQGEVAGNKSSVVVDTLSECPLTL